MKIVTIIPAFNEGKFIKNVINGALIHSDVIVVDDGSTDDTFNIAKDYATFAIRHHKNLGKGAAIKTGFKKALNEEYEIFVLMDGDGQHNPDFIPNLASKLINADIVIGSRFLDEDLEGMPLQRRLSNRLTTKLIKFATGYNITDSQSGFRSISPSAARAFIDIPYNDYVYESEMFYYASKHNMTIEEQEIPCEYKTEISYITWINVFEYLIFIFKLLLRNSWNSMHAFRIKSPIKRISKEE
jgi:glycosyltransferase involved in cell wall biosynthesis